MEYESPELVVEEAEFSQEFYEAAIWPAVIIAGATIAAAVFTKYC